MKMLRVVNITIAVALIISFAGRFIAETVTPNWLMSSMLLSAIFFSFLEIYLKKKQSATRNKSR